MDCSAELGDLAESFFRDDRDHAVVGRIAHGQHHKWPLVSWAIEDTVQETPLGLVYESGLPDQHGGAR